MELRHLKYFIAVAEELNFTKASERLYISQPPLSRQIKELEEELNAQLFKRNNKRVVLTDAGRYFEKEARKLLNSLDEIKIKTRKIAENVSGEFRIAYISSTFSGDISKLLQHLTGLYPYVNFKLYEVPTQKQVLALEHGKLDLGILRAPLYSPKITSKLWFKDTYALVYNKEMLLLHDEGDIKQLKNEAFVFFNKDYAPEYYNSLLEICAVYGFVPNVVHEANNVNSIIQLVRNGIGVSIVPSKISRSHSYPEIGYIDLNAANLYSEVLLATPVDENSPVTQSALSFLLP
ncbi:MAG TPA: LysR family transcriptional regulator [Cytophagales bacterium]|nr:LysR family transcriptional regulator [Cytophagales bacterium]